MKVRTFFEAVDQDKSLSAPSLHLLTVIFMLCDNRHGYCRESYQQLMKMTKLSRSTMLKHIKILEASGWIECEKGDAATLLPNKYTFNMSRILE